MSGRETRRRKGPSRVARWALACLLGVGSQALLLLALSLTSLGSMFAPVQVKDLVLAKPVALRSISSATWQQNRAVDPRRQSARSSALPAPEAPKPPEPPKPKEPEPIPKGKVVDVAPGNGQRPDDDAKFLAPTNNRVPKETFSKDATTRYENAAPRPSSTVAPSDGAGRDLVDRAVIAGNGGTGQEDKPASDGSKKAVFEVPRVSKREELALKFDGLGGTMKNQRGSQEVKGNSDRLLIQMGGSEGEDADASSGRAGTPNLVTLAPSARVLDRIVGAPASDLIPSDDVEIGAGTYLNTKEWKHSTFFNRIKQYVGMHWDPNTAVRTKDPTGEIYLYKDRYTVVAVTLDRNGTLKQIGVDKSSGVDFLDREAMAAFQRAAPFPNPPPALQNERGEISFTFGFYLEVGRSGLQLFRPAR